MSEDTLVATALVTTTTNSMTTMLSAQQQQQLLQQRAIQQPFVTVAQHQQQQQQSNGVSNNDGNYSGGKDGSREANLISTNDGCVDGVLRSLTMKNNINTLNGTEKFYQQQQQQQQRLQLHHSLLSHQLVNGNNNNSNNNFIGMDVMASNGTLKCNENGALVNGLSEQIVNNNSNNRTEIECRPMQRKITVSTTSDPALDKMTPIVGIVPSACSVNTVMPGPGAWYHEGNGCGGGDESSGFYSGASGFSGSGSAAASCGAPADCSPPSSSCHGGIGGAADFDTNFDDEFDQLLLKSTDPNLPGSRNVTESVEVPSSEHVAEIVGRQGCKIKALRAKTNTYIKTPVRGEEPVFVVTGRLEDVQDAKREIECAAEHFTQIRASRRHSQGGAPAPGHVTAYVRVPLRVVGLVVGPKGATIKRIQQDTHTYIITPSREREPIFEVTGLPQNVEAARREIEQHIYQRTGNMPITDPSASIANFDLSAAAAQVAVHAAVNNNANRPNYGALAAANANQQQQQQLMQQQQQQEQNSFADYQKQQTNWQIMDYRNDGFANNSAPYVNNTTMCHSNGLSAAFSTMSLDVFHQQHQHPQSQQQTRQKSLFAPGCPNSAAPQQQQEASYLFNSYDSAVSVAQHHQQQHLQMHQNGSSNVNSQLIRSESTNQNGTESASWFKDRPYQPWSTNSDFNLAHDIFSSTNSAVLNSGTYSSSPNQLDFLTGAGAVTGAHGSCGLSSINSTSRDEGLGDSPINSIGKQTTDFFNLITSSIWSNPIETNQNTPRDKIDIATPHQLATA